MGVRTMVFPVKDYLPCIQGSVHNLTLDEFQGQLSKCGKSLNVMNDELLNSVIAVEQQTDASSSSMTSIAQLLSGNYKLNCTSSSKTVDEVWRDNIKQEDQGKIESEIPETFGKLALEDFVIRPGDISMECRNGSEVEKDLQNLLPVNPVQKEEWLQYQLASSQQQQHTGLLASDLYGNSISNSGLVENQQMEFSMVPITMESPSAAEAYEIMDKSIDRRQKRMIKNRESAARSRARKQAYISKLEEEVRRLTDKFKQLMKQREQEILLHLSTPREPRYHEERNNSGPL